MTVKYLPQFERALDNMLTCNRQYYSRKVLSSLVSMLRKYRDLLKDNPLMGQSEPLLQNLSVDYRYIVFSGSLKLIYFVVGDTVFFADLWDIRQSQENLKKRIID